MLLWCWSSLIEVGGGGGVVKAAPHTLSPPRVKVGLVSD